MLSLSKQTTMTNPTHNRKKKWNTIGEWRSNRERRETPLTFIKSLLIRNCLLQRAVLLGDFGKLLNLSVPLDGISTGPQSCCEDYICKAFEECLTNDKQSVHIIVITATIIIIILNFKSLN